MAFKILKAFLSHTLRSLIIVLLACSAGLEAEYHFKETIKLVE
ncbi:hypothetical protein NFD58_12615 [Staphylococcus epidermidis]|nr:hypothetical protein [Staphylococcus epidermidis]